MIDLPFDWRISGKLRSSEGLANCKPGGGPARELRPIDFGDDWVLFDNGWCVKTVNCDENTRDIVAWDKGNIEPMVMIEQDLR